MRIKKFYVVAGLMVLLTASPKASAHDLESMGKNALKSLVVAVAVKGIALAHDHLINHATELHRACDTKSSEQTSQECWQTRANATNSFFSSYPWLFRSTFVVSFLSLTILNK
jgi:hypothetical protein